MSSEAVVGKISIESNKKFKFLVNVSMLGKGSKENIIPILVKIGDNSIPLNKVVELNTKKIHGTFSITFAIDWGELETEEFQAEISFTFFPF
ncbi:MAG: hypothetical protein WHS64_04655 [Fervidobacterium sp.]|uniref:hypothetical protein n=1 Tax=Fervidobacterium TaxID=2422 RepID=UPI0030B5F3A2